MSIIGVGAPVGWLVGDFDCKTIPAELKLGFGLSLAIQAKIDLCFYKLQILQLGRHLKKFTQLNFIGEVHKINKHWHR